MAFTRFHDDPARIQKQLQQQKLQSEIANFDHVYRKVEEKFFSLDNEMSRLQENADKGRNGRKH